MEGRKGREKVELGNEIHKIGMKNREHSGKEINRTFVTLETTWVMEYKNGAFHY